MLYELNSPGYIGFDKCQVSMISCCLLTSSESRQEEESSAGSMGDWGGVEIGGFVIYRYVMICHEML